MQKKSPGQLPKIKSTVTDSAGGQMAIDSSYHPSLVVGKLKVAWWKKFLVEDGLNLDGGGAEVEVG